MFFCQCCAVNGLKGEFKRNYCSFSFLLPSYLPETEAVLADIHCLFILILLNIFFVNYVYMKCQKFLLYLARLPFFSSTGCTVKGCSDYSSVLLWRLFFFFFSKGIIPWSASHLSMAGTHSATEILSSHIFLNYSSSLSYSPSLCIRKELELQPTLSWTALTSWKLLKELLPIKTLSRKYCSEKYQRRESEWWHTTSQMDFCVHPWKCACTLLKMTLLFLEGIPFQSTCFLGCLWFVGLRMSVSTQVKKIFDLGCPVCFQGRGEMQ